LKVTVDCGACAVKPSIPFVIIEGYNQAANNDGRKVSTTSEANLTIKAYTARDDAARLLFGAFAGKDEIKAVVAYQGKPTFLKTTTAIPFLASTPLRRRLAKWATPN
jgi:hypothetical protein